MSKKKLLACLLNISEGRDEQIIQTVLQATVKSIRTNKVPATILNVFSNKEYNRTVISISGEKNGVKSAVAEAAIQANSLIDMNKQTGTHPRLGAVDLIPIHPLTANINLEECGHLAHNIATDILAKEPKSSFFFYRSADEQKRSLIQRRKQIGWFSRKVVDSPDLGVYHSQLGVTGVGASYYMTNFNIIINTQDREIGKKILISIREKSGGFQGVSAMAFDYQNGIEIACNVDMFTETPANIEHVTEVMPGVWRAKFSSIEEKVEQICTKHNINIRDNSMVIGFTPEDAARRTEQALQDGIPDYYLDINNKNIM